jgi:hypothetical protein
MPINLALTSCLCYNQPSAEGYPSGLRGWFAKSLVWGDLEREFESPLLRQAQTLCYTQGVFVFYIFCIISLEYIR